MAEPMDPTGANEVKAIKLENQRRGREGRP